jgi:hypothetical protein
MGDRTPGDEGAYCDDDLKAALAEGKCEFVRGVRTNSSAVPMD